MSVLEVSGSDADGDAGSVTLKAAPPLSGVTATGRQSRARGATPRELADTFAKLLGGGSVLLAMWLEVEEAALEPAEANAIAEPLARIVNRANWGKALAKRLVGADDYLALSLALFSYTVRVYPLIAAKWNANAKPIANPGQQATPVRAAASDGVDASNGHYDPSKGPGFDPSLFTGWAAD